MTCSTPVWQQRERAGKGEGGVQRAHICADSQATDDSNEDDGGLDHIQDIQRCESLELHSLVGGDCPFKLSTLQLVIAEVFHCLIVEQCICGPCILGVVQLVHVPANMRQKNVKFADLNLMTMSVVTSQVDSGCQSYDLHVNSFTWHQKHAALHRGHATLQILTEISAAQQG